MADFADNSVPPDRADGDGTESADDLASRSRVDSIERPPLWDAANGLLNPALWWAENGFAVMPLRRLGNRPHQMLGSGWSFSTVGSKDPQQVRHWWSQDPVANIGVTTGAPSRLLVVDVDVKQGTNGFQSLRESGLDLPETVTVDTPSGGRHLWFRLPDGCGRVPSPQGLVPGVDIRADGAMVAVPPSHRERVVRGGLSDPKNETATIYLPYELNPGVLAEAPEGLLAAIASGPVGRSTAGTFEATGDVLPPLEWFLVHGFRLRSRNSDCHRLALRLFGKYGGDEAIVVGLTHRVWSVTAQGSDPFPWSEAYGALRSAQRRYTATRNEHIAAAEALMRRWTP